MRAVTRPIRVSLLLAAAAVLIVSTSSLRAQAPADIQKAVDAAYAKYQNLQEGKNADYIPALAKVDPKLFGIALVTADGKVYTAGNVATEVSIQSISKVFTAAQVIRSRGSRRSRNGLAWTQPAPASIRSSRLKASRSWSAPARRR
jgi:glutaminase